MLSYSARTENGVTKRVPFLALVANSLQHVVPQLDASRAVTFSAEMEAVRGKVGLVTDAILIYLVTEKKSYSL